MEERRERGTGGRVSEREREREREPCEPALEI